MSNANDALTIKTGIDNSGIYSDAKQFKSAIQSLKFEVDRVGKSMSSSGKGYADSVYKAAKAYNELTGQLKRLESTAKSMRSQLENPAGRLDKQINQTKVKMAELRAQINKLNSMPMTASSFKKTEELNQKLEEAKQRYRDLKKEQAKLASPDYKQSAEYMDLARQYNAVALRIQQLRQSSLQAKESFQPWIKSWREMTTLSGTVGKALDGLNHVFGTIGLAIRHPIQAVNRLAGALVSLVGGGVISLLKKLASSAANVAIQFAKLAGSAIASGLRNIAKFVGGAIVGGLARIAAGAKNAAIGLARMTGGAIISALGKLGSAVRNVAAQLMQIGGRAVKGALSGLGRLFAKGTKAVLDFGKSTRRTNGGMKTSLKTILKYAFGVRSMFFLFRRLRSAVSDGLGAIAKRSPQLKAATDMLSKSFNALKGSLGSAFAPIVTAVAPALTKLINLLTNAMNTVGAFIAALTGQKFYQKSIGAIGDSADKSAKSVKGLNRELASFDKLDILGKDNNSSSGSSDSDGFAYQTEVIDSGISDFAKKIKELWKNQDYEGIGGVIAGGINTAFEKANKLINSKELENKLNNIIDIVTGIVNGLADNLKWKEIGETIGDGINLIADKFNDLMDKVKWDEIGDGIAEGLNGLVDKIDPKVVGEAFTKKIDAIFDVMRGFVKKFKWGDAGTKFGETASSFVDNVNWDTIGDTLSTGAKGALNFITSAIKAFDWKQACIDLESGINAVDWTGVGTAFAETVNALFEIDWEAIGTLINTGVNGVLDALLAIVKNFKWGDAGTAFLSAIKGLYSKKTLDKLSELLSDGINGVITTFKTIVSGFSWGQAGTDFASAVNNLKEKINWTNLGVTLGGLLKGSIAMLRSTVRGFDWGDAGTKFGQLVNTIKDQVKWSDVGDTLKRMMKGVLAVMVSSVRTISWGTAGKDFANALNAFFKPDGDENVWKLAADTINEAAKGLVDFTDKFIVTADWENIGTQIRNGFTSIKWKEIATSVWGLLEDAFKATGSLLNSLLGGETTTKKYKVGDRYGNITEVVETDASKAFDGVGEKLKDGFNGAVQALTKFIPTIKIEDMTKALFTWFTTVANGVNWTAVGALVGVGIGKAMSAAGTLVAGFAGTAKTMGGNLAEFLNSAIGKIDWDSDADTSVKSIIQNSFKGAIGAVTGFFEKFDAVKFGQELGSALGDVDWAGIAQDIWDALVTAFQKIGDFLSALLGNTTVTSNYWASRGMKTHSQGQKKTGVAAIADNIGGLIGDLLDSISDKLANLPWDEWGEAIGTFFREFDWVGTGEKLAQALKSAFNGIQDLVWTAIYGDNYQENSKWRTFHSKEAAKYDLEKTGIDAEALKYVLAANGWSENDFYEMKAMYDSGGLDYFKQDKADYEKLLKEIKTESAYNVVKDAVSNGQEVDVDYLVDTFGVSLDEATGMIRAAEIAINGNTNIAEQNTAANENNTAAVEQNTQQVGNYQVKKNFGLDDSTYAEVGDKLWKELGFDLAHGGFSVDAFVKLGLDDDNIYEVEKYFVEKWNEDNPEAPISLTVDNFEGLSELFTTGDAYKLLRDAGQNMSGIVIEGLNSGKIGIRTEAGEMVLEFADGTKVSLGKQEDGIVGLFKALGVDMSEGAIDGMSDEMKSSLLELAKIFGIPEEEAKKTLEISSPSKVFKGIGEYVIEGLVNGLKSIGKKLKGIWDALPKGLKTTVNKLVKLFTGMESDVDDIFDLLADDAEKNVKGLPTWMNNNVVKKIIGFFTGDSFKQSGTKAATNLSSGLKSVKMPTLEPAIKLIKDGWDTVAKWVTEYTGGDVDKPVGVTRNKFTTVAQWIKDNLMGGDVDKGVGVTRNNFTSIAQWITDNFMGTDVNKGIGVARNKFTDIAQWIKDNYWGDTVNKDVGVTRNKNFTTIADWLKANWMGDTVNKGVGVTRNKGFTTIADWLKANWMGDTVNKDVGVTRNKNFTTVANWLKSKWMGDTVNKDVGVTRNKNFTTVANWLKAKWMGDTVNKDVGVTRNKNFTTVANWLKAKWMGDTVNKDVGVTRNKNFTTIADWLKAKWMGGDVNKPIGWTKNTTYKTIADWIKDKLLGGGVNKPIGWTKNTTYKTVADWIKDTMLGGGVNKPIGWSKNTTYNTVADWINGNYMGGDVSYPVKLRKYDGWGDDAWYTVSAWVGQFMGDTTVEQVVGLISSGWYYVRDWVNSMTGGNATEAVELTNQGTNWASGIVNFITGGLGYVSLAIDFATKTGNAVTAIAGALRKALGIAAGGIVTNSGQYTTFASGGLITGGGFSGWWNGIPKYAAGTRRAHGSMFVAGEAGPEIIGHINGRTEILNKSQLAQTMYGAVTGGMAAALRGLQFRMPAMATGSVMPYSVAEQIAKSTSDLQSTMNANNEDLIQTIISVASQVVVAVNGLQEQQGRGVNGYNAQRILDDLNRRTQMFFTSPLKGV